jgi:hypothetical protein
METFLDAFFGDGNLIDREQVDSTAALRRLVADLTEDLARPVVLPRRTSAAEVDWFVLCGDDTTLRRLQAEAQAFVGVSYGRWEGARARLDLDDPVERAVADFSDGRAVRFRTASDEEFRECWAALDLMRSAWKQRPEAELERVRTGATLVREFELAIAAGDAATASELVAELRRRGLLGTENLRFLEIRQLAARGRWDELAASADLADLARIRRPWLVTEDLLTGLYRAHVASHEATGDVASAVTATTAIVNELPGLFTTRGPLRSSDVVKLFALRFALPGRQDVDRLRELQELPDLRAEDRAWMAAIVEHVSGSRTPARTAREAFAEGDLDTAFVIALGDSVSTGRAELLIECAFELGTLEAAQAALTAVDALAPDDRNALLERRLIAVALDEVSNLADPPEGVAETPTSWTTWLERLMTDTNWRGADAVALCGELEYTASDLMDTASAERLASLMLEAADSEQQEAFRDALPRIVGWLERQDVHSPVARPVHRAVLTVVALDDSWRETSLEVAYNVAEALLRGGLDPDGYVEMLDQLALLWERMTSRAHASWLADLLELLDLHPGPRESQVGFAAAVVGRALAFANRLDEAIVAGLATSCEGIGAHELAATLRGRVDAGEVVQQVPPDALQGRLVGIYTLSPQVAMRARDAIARRFPGVQVEVDSSFASTSSLEHLAATADYLIVSLRSAKHAATDAIERHRPRELPTLIPRGRGSSRMVEALLAAISAE